MSHLNLTGHYNVHVDGSFTVLVRPDGKYEAHVRLADSDMLRVGVANTPRNAVSVALGVN